MELFEVYGKTARRFEDGYWMRGSYGEDGYNCLVGGLNRTMMEDKANGVWSFGEKLPPVMVKEIRHRLRRYPTFQAVRLLAFIAREDDDQQVIEMWNDLFRWRRPKRVARVLSDLADKHEAGDWKRWYEEVLAEKEDLARLLKVVEGRNRSLLARIAHLRQDEVVVSQEMRDLDAQLDAELARIVAHL